MKRAITFVLLVISVFAKAQYYSYCDKNAEFPGGDKAIEKFVHDNIIYPAKELAEGYIGKYVGKLYIDTSGKLVRVESTSFLPNTLNYQVERALLKLPAFIPAENRGKKVAFILSVPVVLRIDDYITQRSNLLWNDSLAKPIPKPVATKPLTPLQNRHLEEIQERGKNGVDGYQTRFVDMEFNFVNERVTKLLEDMKLYAKDNGKFTSADAIVFDYGKLHVKYHIKADTLQEGVMIITKCDIDGDIFEAIKFFAFFWNTSIKFDGLKDNDVIAARGYYNERITFKVIPGKVKALISIRKNT